MVSDDDDSGDDDDDDCYDELLNDYEDVNRRPYMVGGWLRRMIPKNWNYAFRDPPPKLAAPPISIQYSQHYTASFLRCVGELIVMSYDGFIVVTDPRV